MNEVDEKTERLTTLCHETDVAGILIQSQPAFAWLTGGRSNRIDGSRENGNGALFVRHDGRRFVIANAIEMPRLIGEELAGGDWEPIEYPWTDDHVRPTALVEHAAQLTTIPMPSERRIGADSAIAGAEFLERPIARARALLTPAEVVRYRALGADAGIALGTVARALQPGMTEVEIARQIADAAAAIGGRATVVLVAADDRIVKFRHPVPTSTAWQRRVMLVACIQRGGLIVALSRIISAATPDADVIRRTEATARVFGRLLDATRPGARGRDLFAAARDAYTAEGFAGEELKHHQGGAIGYRSREWVAHPASDEVVEARQAFAWNPSITGTKVEDTALLTENGIELITATPRWPTIYEAAAILTL